MLPPRHAYVYFDGFISLNSILRESASKVDARY